MKIHAEPALRAGLILAFTVRFWPRLCENAKEDFCLIIFCSKQRA
jgi:hypothetical protein